MICATTPAFNLARVATSLYNLEATLPEEVWKPSKGLYMHSRFKVMGAIEETARSKKVSPKRVREDVFYQTFADWLKNDAEEVTHAIPLGGNVFGDRWGTPDVIGKREARRSDVIKAPTEIVAAEIKVDMVQLVTGYGQACAYRLFCHRSYLVIPQQSTEDVITRLDALCEISGIALVLFDADAPEAPAFKVLVRSKYHQPDLFYTNRYLALIEQKLFS